ncbi:hypothetical protein DY000_02022775 [Brassica cretica]|uniref:Uncharacterized protein n=1 Tax=Brassica cretica TaxID=69181 RepID=A0ABQ7EF81_BRACR|nr:hypothetical protein DY000_02022775 [Brassica cretica]
MYAIGESANVTINSQGNRYAAPKNLYAKEVTKRVRTETSECYESASSLAARPASMVDSITSSTAGALGCRIGRPCY